MLTIFNRVNVLRNSFVITFDNPAVYPPKAPKFAFVIIGVLSAFGELKHRGARALKVKRMRRTIGQKLLNTNYT